MEYGNFYVCRTFLSNYNTQQAYHISLLAFSFPRALINFRQSFQNFFNIFYNVPQFIRNDTDIICFMYSYRDPHLDSSQTPSKVLSAKEATQSRVLKRELLRWLFNLEPRKSFIFCNWNVSQIFGVINHIAGMPRRNNLLICAQRPTQEWGKLS